MMVCVEPRSRHATAAGRRGPAVSAYGASNLFDGAGIRRSRLASDLGTASKDHRSHRPPPPAPGASDVFRVAGIYTFTGHGIVLCAPAAIRHDPLPDTSISVRVLPSCADDIQAGANTIILPARLVPAASR